MHNLRVRKETELERREKKRGAGQAHRRKLSINELDSAVEQTGAKGLNGHGPGPRGSGPRLETAGRPKPGAGFVQGSQCYNASVQLTQKFHGPLLSGPGGCTPQGLSWRGLGRFADQHRYCARVGFIMGAEEGAVLQVGASTLWSWLGLQGLAKSSAASVSQLFRAFWGRPGQRAPMRAAAVQARPSWALCLWHSPGVVLNQCRLIFSLASVGIGELY